MRSLVTGASGFVGSHLIDHLIECGDEVIGTTFGEGVMVPCKTVPLDVTDREECRRIITEVRPDAVYHLAGIASPPAVSGDLKTSLLVNVGGVHSVLSAAAGLPTPPRVLVVSSGEVYGGAGADGVPLNESTHPSPRNEYALSKIMAEETALLFARRDKLPVVIARPFNHTGPRQSDAFVVAAFAKQLAEIVTAKRGPVIEVGNLGARRDFTDVRDVVRAYRLLITQEATGIFNIASGVGVSIEDILHYLIALAETSVTVKPDSLRMRPAEVPVVIGSAAKVRAITGWVPHYSLKQTLADTLEWWLQREGVVKHSHDEGRAAGVCAAG